MCKESNIQQESPQELAITDVHTFSKVGVSALGEPPVPIRGVT